MAGKERKVNGERERETLVGEVFKRWRHRRDAVN